MQILFLVDSQSTYDQLQEVIRRITAGSCSPGECSSLSTAAGFPADARPDLLFINLTLPDTKCPELVQELKVISQEVIPQNILPGSASTSFSEKNAWHTRFISKLGDSIRSVPIADIAYFYTENKLSYLCTNRGRKLPVDYNLDQIEKKIDPKAFFRINRQFIIGHHAIGEMKAHTRSRIIVRLAAPHQLDTTVALDRAYDFRRWISE